MGEMILKLKEGDLSNLSFCLLNILTMLKDKNIISEGIYKELKEQLDNSFEYIEIIKK